MADILPPTLCDLSSLNQLPTRKVEPLSLESDILVWDPQQPVVSVRGVSIKIDFADSEGVQKKELWNRLVQVLQGVDRRILQGISKKIPLSIQIGSRNIFERDYPKRKNEEKSVMGAYFRESNKIFVFSDRLLNTKAQGGKNKAERVYSVYQHALFHELGHAIYYQMLNGVHFIFDHIWRKFPHPPLFVIQENGISFSFPDKKGAPNASELFAEGFREIYSRRLAGRSIDYKKAKEENANNHCLIATIESFETTEQFMSAR